jgi:hypothetical protein
VRLLLDSSCVRSRSAVQQSVLVAFVLSLTACSSLTNWPSSGVLPDHFDTRAVLTLSGTEVLIGGCKDGKLRLDDCSAAIYRLEGNALQLVYEGAGRVDRFARVGNVVFADAAIYSRQANSNRHRLLRSIDGGKHFEEWKPMPMTSVQQLLAAGPEEIWCLGADSLSRTTDAGASWTDVVAPGERNSAKEKIAIARGSVLILGAPLHLTSDGGRTWRSIDTGGVRVRASNDELLAGTRGGQVLLGRLAGDVIRWGHDLNLGNVWPLQLAVLDRGRLMMATTPPLDAPAGFLRIYSSSDDGDRWHEERMKDVHQAKFLDLAGDGHAHAVDLSGSVLRAPPEHE